MKYKIIILTCLITVLINNVFAQKDTLKNEVFGAFVILPLEFPVIDNREINQELNELGFPSANYSTANLGIGLQLYSNRWITTFSFNKTTKNNENDTYLTEVEYRSLSFNVGFDLTKNHRYSIYPFIGVKNCGLNYLYRDIISNETVSTNEIGFDDYFGTSLEYKEITNSRTHLDLGMGASFQWFFLINLRAGYLLPLQESKWHVNNHQFNLADAPSLNYNYYFSLTVGLGNIVSEKELRPEFVEGGL